MNTPGAESVLNKVLGELAAVRAENAAMREENQTLTARVDALDRQSSGHQGQPKPSGRHRPITGDGDTADIAQGLSRRRLLARLAGAGAVGAGVLAVGDTLGPRTAEAASGDNMVLGQSNDAGAGSTQLKSTSSTTLEVDATGTVSGFEPVAILGSSMGTGVDAIGGIYGVRAFGSLAHLLLVPFGGAGAPTTGTHRAGEILLDANAALFECVAAGTPGTWVRVGFNPLNPTRILDTRNTKPIPPNTSINLTVGGSFGVPNQASAIVMNATVTEGTAQSFLTIYPEGTTKPLASNLNWSAGETIPNLVTVGLGSGGGISIFNAAGSVDVVLDLAGFYS